MTEKSTSLPLEPRASDGRPISASTCCALAVLLSVHALLAVTAIRRNSVTVDEVSHLPAGISYWQTGTFALYHHNPPLVKMLAAAAALTTHPEVDYSGSWERAKQGRYPPSQAAFGNEFMKSNAQRYFEIYFRARYAIVALSVVGGLFVFLWAQAMWGPSGGLIAAALWTFSPNLLAHGGLVTTDLGAAVSGFAATYFFWRWLCCPSWKRAGWAGIALGIAQLVKFSNLLLLGLWPVMALGWMLMERRKPDPQGDATRRAGWGGARKHGPLMLLVCLLVINLGYGFEGTGRLLGSYEFLSQDLTAPRTSGAPPFHPDRVLQNVYQERQNRFQGSLLGFVPVPLPEHYVLGFDEQRFETDPGLEIGGYPVYLRGELRRTGWWYYYLYALAVKVPLGTWLLLGTAVLMAVLRAPLRAVAGNEWVIALPPLAMLAAMSLLTDINLGLRYVLPVFPYLFVFIARLGKGWVGSHPLRIALMAVVGVALGWNGVQAVAIWPHYLSYFNRLAGGPAGGHRHLIDSNLDWGQDLLELRRWLDASGESGPIGLAYFGTVDPEIAGIDFFLPPRDRRGAPEGRRRLPSDRRKIQPGLYAVSVTYLQGLPFRSRVEGRRVENHANAFRYFQALEPVDRAGYSIMIYRVGADDAETLNRVLHTSSKKVDAN